MSSVEQPKVNATLLVERDDPKTYLLRDVPLPELSAGEILIRIDKFALTANNLTYVVLGKSFKYFDFFSAPDEPYGRVNAWATGTVTHARDSTTLVGERVYGYFPAAQYHILKPANESKDSFFVIRDQLPADRKVYNQYSRLAHDPYFSPEFEDLMLVFRPLWWTSFFLDDYLHECKSFGAKTAVISSASSKTSFGLAFFLKQRGFPVVALTSAKNCAFVKRLGVYDSVLEYDQIKQLPGDQSLVFVDVAGDQRLQQRILEQFGDNVTQIVKVGISHWDSNNNSNNSSTDKEVQDSRASMLLAKYGDRIKLFFAPAWIKKRQQDLGEQLQARMVRDAFSTLSVSQCYAAYLSLSLFSLITSL